MPVTILDGPMGTELLVRGVPTPLPGWSAHALESAPEVVRAIHADYAAAGATVHTANTFRTKRRLFPDDWERLARLAVGLCRGAVPAGHRVAGSIAPLEDCYRPELSPGEASRAEHRQLARVLADARCDVILCEAFPAIAEGLVAAEEAVATGVETWLSFTAGPDADLLTAVQVGEGAREAIGRGARAVLVNCVPAARTGEFVRALASACSGTDVRFGAYANAGMIDDLIGWKPSPQARGLYADLAAGWIARGGTIVGSCCGTGPGHIAELARRFGGLK